MRKQSNSLKKPEVHIVSGISLVTDRNGTIVHGSISKKTWQTIGDDRARESHLLENKF
jgi:hypothetical protein